MSLKDQWQNIFNAQTSTARQSALQNTLSSTNSITTTGGGLTNYPMYSSSNQTYQVPYIQQWPTMTLTLKDVALLHRMCGDDEEIRAVLNKILPHFKLEA